SQLLWVSRFHRTSHTKRRKRRNRTIRFSLANSPSSRPELCGQRTKRRNSIPDFSLTTPPNFISWCDQILAVVPVFYGRGSYATISTRDRRQKKHCFSLTGSPIGI